jgi:hypothetical protein
MDLQCALPRPNIVVLLVDRDDGAFEALSYISLDAPPPLPCGCARVHNTMSVSGRSLFDV